MMTEKNKNNDPCPCGSGIIYEKCHGRNQSHIIVTKICPESFKNLPPIIKQIIEQERREKLIGDIKPIKSADANGYKFIAVGSDLYFAKKPNNFHSFLFAYIRHNMGNDWYDYEIKKEKNELHPILQWYKFICDFKNKYIIKESDMQPVISLAPLSAYLSLAFDLYILRHHSVLQKRLVERLKIKEQFQGARYEIYMTASFIKAGFSIEFEDESDKLKSHCEFIATHKLSGKKYSVEAKSRHRPGLLGQNGSVRNPGRVRLRVGGLLRSALKKEASNTRIVFIDINMPPDERGPLNTRWFKSLTYAIRKLEKDNNIDDKPIPSAYLFFTNDPHHYVGEGEADPEKDFLMTTINMPHLEGKPMEAIERFDPNILSLLQSIGVHTRIPIDFDR